ncbi:MAG: 2-C-methyl-D-erythritol 4-phosphate cytidylyltransferase [Chlamydiae bacterium]|nr:2-C-methyl-D-erythritol 4-phosphate cytidylyltransferase [Chlamydiota bacterium]
MITKKDISVIFLAGGVGSRFQSDTPKQFLPLGHSPVALHSFNIFCTLPNVSEIVVVCAPEYHEIFKRQQLSTSTSLKFASPGVRRQDSVFNGLQVMSGNTISYTCIHDAARPLITAEQIHSVVNAAREHGAATIGMPVRYTVKEVDKDDFAANTPDRTNIWEIQTPQVIRTDWLKEGFDYVNKNNLTVTDDVSVVEQLNYPVKLVRGSHHNLKITVPEDLMLAEKILLGKSVVAEI